MSAICDAHKKKVDVELLYNSVHRIFSQFGDQTSWGSDELEIRCGRENQHPGLRLSSSGERERNADGQ